MAIALTLAGVTICLFARVQHGHPKTAIELRFDQLQAYTDDNLHFQALRDFGPGAVPFLAVQLERKDSVLNSWYVSIWPRLPNFVRSRIDRPASAAAIRYKAVRALRAVGPSLTASDLGVSALITALSDPDLQVVAEGALGDLGPRAKSAVPALLRSVERETRTVTGDVDINGIWALGRIGPQAKAALPLLELRMMAHGGRERVFAAEALLRIGGDRTAAINALRTALTDLDSEARRQAAAVLSDFGQPTDRSTARLSDKSE